MNRSAPPAPVIPVLTYPDVRAAVDWLVDVFGFEERIRITDHRAQMSAGNGAVIVADESGDRRAPRAGASVTHSVMVRVDNIDAHHARVSATSGVVVSAPQDHPYGERQYSAVDLAGHRWTFTQTVANAAPEEWGGETIRPW